MTSRCLEFGRTPRCRVRRRYRSSATLGDSFHLLVMGQRRLSLFESTYRNSSYFRITYDFIFHDLLNDLCIKFPSTWSLIDPGDFNIHEIDKVSKRLQAQYGDIVKIEGLLNRPDMVFVYDANEIERIFRQEEKMPHRPSMPSLDYYKHVLRKDTFKDNPGIIAV